MTRVEHIAEGVTVYCGDCLEVLPSIETADHLMSDPPYSDFTHEKKRNGAFLPDVKGSALASRRGAACGARYRDLGFKAIPPRVAFAVARHAARIVKRWNLVFTDAENIRLWQRSFERATLEHVRVGAWVKLGCTPQFTGDRPGSGIEAIEIAHRPGRKRWNGGGHPAVWTYPIVLNRHSVERVHSTQKPVDLMKELVSDFSDVGEVILDPFMGSGTTGVAAVKLGRGFIGVEKDDGHFDTSCRRIAEALKQPDMFIVQPKPVQEAML